MEQTERGDRNGGEKASGQMTPALPETPAHPAEHLGAPGEQGHPGAGVRLPHTGWVGSEDSRTPWGGVQTVKEEEVPEEGSHISKPERERKRQTGVPHWFLIPQAGGSALVMKVLSGAVHQSVQPPRSDPGRQRGTPFPQWPSLPHPGGAGNSVQAGFSASALTAANYKLLLSLSSLLGLWPSPASFSCWFSLLLLKTWTQSRGQNSDSRSVQRQELLQCDQRERQ